MANIQNKGPSAHGAVWLCCVYDLLVHRKVSSWIKVSTCTSVGRFPSWFRWTGTVLRRELRVGGLYGLDHSGHGSRTRKEPFFILQTAYIEHGINITYLWVPWTQVHFHPLWYPSFPNQHEIRNSVSLQSTQDWVILKKKCIVLQWWRVISEKKWTPADPVVSGALCTHSRASLRHLPQETGALFLEGLWS